jgi:[acyl-carrier-protein] S-malonyltransferase
MADAAASMQAVLSTVHFVDPEPPLIGNATGRPISTADGARRELVEHLTAGVDWVVAIRTMTEAGVETFVEVGPGRVLTGLIKRIAPEARALALDDPAAAGGLAAAAVEAALEASSETVGAGRPSPF